MYAYCVVATAATAAEQWWWRRRWIRPAETSTLSFCMFDGKWKHLLLHPPRFISTFYVHELMMRYTLDSWYMLFAKNWRDVLSVLEILLYALYKFSFYLLTYRIRPTSTTTALAENNAMQPCNCELSIVARTFRYFCTRVLVGYLNGYPGTRFSGGN